MLNDPPRHQLLRPGRLVGSWFVAHSSDGGGIVWDAYYLYGRDATWTSEPGPLLSSSRSVISASADLATAFRNLG